MDEGKVYVRGRFDSLQVAADAQDVQIPVPAGVTHVELHFYDDQPCYYSLTGGANSWIPVHVTPPLDYTGSLRIYLEGATNLYLRKPRNPRHLSWDRAELIANAGSLFGGDVRQAVADDRIALLNVTFTQ